MNLGVFLLGFLLSFLSANVDIPTINHDQVQPFPEQEPTTDSEKSAVKYKPQLHVSDGCHPYPAVQANGEISGGLKWSGKPDGDCADGASLLESGHRHLWSFVIVWTDNPNPDNSTILGVSTSPLSVNYEMKAPIELKYIVNGTTLKLDFYKDTPNGKSSIKLTEKPGRTQNLITWEQLTNEARDALSEFDFEGSTLAEVVMPLKDTVFTALLEQADPY
ncbi:hypothetical protein PI124_g8416 [Phytophthora idaei]|nr:hypothetical protein PI124_g8416 [Phytophthora idaei]